MNRWLLKTEPADYSYEDLERERRDIWDGVKNNQALQFLRQIQSGDLAFIYHTGKEKRVFGVAEVVSDPYADPQLDDAKLVVVDLKAKQRLPKSVSLADIKADPKFADFLLVRNSRLSVMPVPTELWHRIARMGGV